MQKNKLRILFKLIIRVLKKLILLVGGRQDLATHELTYYGKACGTFHSEGWVTSQLNKISHDEVPDVTFLSTCETTPKS